MRRLIIFGAILAVGAAVAWYILWPRDTPAADLNISRHVLGSEMRITSAQFDHLGNSLRLQGHWEGHAPGDHYLVRATVSDTPDGPASSGMFWYSGGTQSGPGGGVPFCIEFGALPASARQLFAHVYFADKRASFSLAAETEFDFSNDRAPRPKGLEALPLPQKKESGELVISLLDLKTGSNFASRDRTPQWFTSARFAVSADGHPTDQWRLMELEIVPNIGTPFSRTLGIPETRDGNVIAPILGTLWKEDGPYELHATFFHVGDSSRESIEGIVIPSDGTVTAIDRVWTTPGVKVHFLGIYGRGARLPKEFDERLATNNSLIFSVDTAEDVWINLARVSIAGTSRQVQEFRRAKGGPGMFSIALGDFLAGQTIGLEFVQLKDKRQVSFVAHPSRD